MTINFVCRVSSQMKYVVQEAVTRCDRHFRAGGDNVRDGAKE
jgi:hypothetical protein